MKQWIRKYLGIDDLLNQVHLYQTQTISAETTIRKLDEANRVLLAGLGRVVAKLDPNYGMDDHDPKRKAESDEIGSRAIKKMMGENAMQERNRP